MVFDAPSAHALLISARTAGKPGERDGITLFFVPADAPRLSQLAFSRLDGGRASHLRFDALRLPMKSVIGGVDQGADVIDNLYQHGLAALCGEALAAMHDTSLQYLKVRQQFSKPIGTFQSLQHRQVEMYCALEEATSLTQTTTMALADGLPDASRLLSMAKVQTSRSSKAVGQGAIQLHGGIGMTEELSVGAHFKRVTLIETQFGSTRHHLARLAGG